MAGNMTGRTLNNRYLIGERIGIGGMAEVYQGQDNVLGRTVAVKVMLPQYAEDSSFTARFRQEAASAANLSSPYIVNVYDWGQDAETSYIVMEYVRGSDLKTAIEQRGAINQRKVAEIGSQVAQALSVAHNQDIIHRDIKPQNIMVQPDGNVKVMDFGIARAKNSVKAKTSAVLGTAHYISPEQAQGKELTAASDIYSLGVVLYEAATGKLPFDGETAVAVAMMQVNDEPVPPRQVNPNIDPSLEAIILKAMAKNPEERFATARDMRHALNDFLAGRRVKLGDTDERTAVLVTPVVPPMDPNEAGGTQVMPEQVGTSGGRTGGTGNIGGVGGRGRNSSGRTGSNSRNSRNGGNGNNGGGKRKLPLVIGLVAALAVVVIAAALLLNRGPNTVEVPDVSNFTLEEATATLEEAGFTVTSEEDYSDTVVQGLVISQNPRANTQQAPGTTVNLVISRGVEMVVVPELQHLTAAEAKRTLSEMGLNFSAGTAEYSDDIEKDRVVRQEPAADTQVAKGTTVTYYLSAGKEEKKVSVPSVVGSLEGEAESTLLNTSKRFNVLKDYVSSTDVPQGQVISQDPAGGTEVDEDATIYLVVSSGSHFVNLNYNQDGGTVSASAFAVADGGEVTVTITPNSGYYVSAVYDSNGMGYSVAGTGGTVNISNIMNDLWFTVEFAAQEPEPEPADTSTTTGTTTGTTDTSGTTTTTTDSSTTTS